MQDPLAPEESMKHYITPENFSPSLWVSEPQLEGKPIAMNWDEQGRLWICETIDYPNELQPEGAGRDRIRICEDTDGDQRADKFTVFAEKLSIPTALEFYRGGAIVQDGQKTVYLKDLDGDNVADLRQELITGWALGDTHGGVSNFQYGADNWIWAMQGYNASQPVINGQPQQAFKMGFWRFRVEPGPADETAPVYPIVGKDNDGKKIAGKAIDPALFAKSTVRVRELEFVRATNNNTWGLGMSEEGLIFGSTANGNPSNFMPIPNRFYERVQGWAPSTLKMISDTYKFAAVTDKIRQVDWHGGYTAGAGHALYTARKYPKTWWNRLAFVCEPTAHLVGAFLLNRAGADYKSTSPMNLVASDDEWAAPIMAEVGPDGNMWVLDWYNYIVQHNPTPKGFVTGKGNAYESDLRDKKHGRVYRVVYQGPQETLSDAAKIAEAIAARGLAKATPAELVQVLRHPTMRWRLIAQRMLVEQAAKDSTTVTSLLNLVSEQQVDAIGISAGAMHGLWTLQGLGLVDQANARIWSTVSKALSSSVPGVRRAAIQVLPATESSGRLIVQAGLTNDADLQVRLAALLQLSNITESKPDVIAKALSQVDEATIEDSWLLDAWTSAAAANVDSVLAMLVREPKPWSPVLAQRIEILAGHLARSKPHASQLDALLAELTKASDEKIVSVLQGLERGWPSDHTIKLAYATSQSLGSLLEKLPLHGKSLLVQLAENWGATALQGQIAAVNRDLIDVAMNAAQEPKQRLEAAKLMVVMQPNDPSVIDKLASAVTPQTSPEMVVGFLNAMRTSKSVRVAPAILELAPSLTPDAKEVALRVLMARPETTLAMLEAIQEGKMTMNDLPLDQRQALRDHPNPEVRKLAISVMKSGGGIPNADRARLVEEWQSICEQKGDSARGKLLYVKHCALCHQHNGEGQNIGPDLTGMAVHPKHELLTHILDPNRSVEGNFRIYSVLTTDGVVLNGMLAGESRTTVELIDSQGKRQVIQREDIEQFNASRKSLMPEGFESQMDRDGMKDLLEFLTTKGKFLPLSLAKLATAISTKGLFSDRDNGPDRMIFEDWKPKTFENVPFALVDPQDQRTANIILLNGPNGPLPPKMPKTVTIPCNTSAKSIHFLSGVSGWGYPASKADSVSMIVRLKYVDGQAEDHPLRNGIHFADYIRRVDVPESKFVANLRSQQIRYLKIDPKRNAIIKEIELVKGPDASSPIVMAITLETLPH
jgi:putative membrane-bound dehydrogenase-like protein